MSEKLGKCTKAKAVFELKENVVPLYKSKREIPFPVFESTNTGVDRLENCGIIGKIA